ncbi:D-alanyl-D-alanine carboxypeptidase/D-alanyl-D-alanine-endopeptidase [Sporosarcina sp. 179-K 3D1 HS]|uniref:D-alanyl-D-alanine carboxypeptidase/D-alanyl-D-alanine endopeptidase n=1 Tax=Sporosarcina sp. 179-K 3D1 HS TaxID=3232169 RepID=UPI0039A3894E
MSQRSFTIAILSLFLLVLSQIFPPTVEAAAQYGELERSMNQLLTDSRLKNSTSSIVVRKASNGEMVYQYNADRGIAPASNQKLLTAAAALETLGEGYQFRTEVLTDGTVANGVLRGNVYLRGQGDPTLMKKDLDIFATRLANQGVKRIEGNLVGDDTFFDTVRLSPSVKKNQETYSFAAQVSALTLSPDRDYDAGSIIIEAKPTTRGRAAKITLTPATKFVTIVNQSKTVAKGNSNTLRIYRKHGTNTIFITGNAPIGSTGKKEWVAVSNPTAYTLHEFKQSLTDRGIRFSNSSNVRGNTPDSARLLTHRTSMPLKDLIVPFMKLSNNTHAEMLAKTMGKEVFGEGSWDAGLQVMHDFVESSGLDRKQWHLEDASGLSSSNKVSAAQLSELLYQVRSKPWYRSFVQALPVAGANERFIGGTLRNRMKAAPARGNVIAKTGSLTNVNALSGYAETKGGETLIFSILTEGQKTSTIPVIDRMATAIVNTK